MVRLLLLCALYLLALVGSSAFPAEQITGRYYAEKQQFVVGEPITAVFELTNGTSNTIVIPGDLCAWTPFEVKQASALRTPVLHGCMSKPVAFECFNWTTDLRSHTIFRRRSLVEGKFVLDQPGIYRVHATYGWFPRNKNGSDLPFELSSDFDVKLRRPQPGELERAYMPFLHDLHSQDPDIQELAISAITQNPPAFMESVVVELADDPSIMRSGRVIDHVIDGLGRLGTPAARRKLLTMAATASPEDFRQPAIEAIGKFGKPEDCPAMLAIARAETGYPFTKSEAYTMAGQVCKGQVVPILAALLGSGDSQMVMGAIYGLANTASRSAVPPLIALLQSTDPFTRRQAADALATLTHRIAPDDKSGAKAYAHWSKWWVANGEHAKIYGNGQCGTPQPLD